MKYFGSRVFEGIFFPMLISLLFALIIKSDMYTKFPILVCVSFIISIVYNNFMLSRHLFAVKHRRIFYATNYTVQGIALVLSVAFALLNIEDFCLFAFMQYLFLVPFGASRIVSVIVINIIFALHILIIPKIARQKRNRRDMF